MNALELLKTVAAHSGISSEDAGLQQLLGTKSLQSLEIDEEVAKKMTAPRLTMEAAKSNPDLKRHFTAAALNGVDAKVKSLLTSDLLEDEFKTSISQVNTYDNISALTDKILALKTEKVGQTASNQHTINKEIVRLNEELKAEKELKTKMSQDFEAREKSNRTSWEVDKIYSTYLNDLALDEKIPAKIRLATAKSAIDMMMSDRGLKVNIGESGNLELLNKEGQPYFTESNIKPTVEDFIKSGLNENGLWKTKIDTRKDNRAPQSTNDKPLDSNRAQVLEKMKKANEATYKAFRMQ